ncbi:DUF4013 domain-containing protein [Halobellus ordinarius]|uniref:DUF4013 domain-containing protein n=1 Tax=Halobellus ordinarius TaxID=3075120 RepID=UPI0028809911|nr:DUF4013 domain-containing protein [Halobellus sp. ZY16]
MIQQSLQYPRHDDNWITTVIIGGILTLLGVFVIPTILVFGYFVRVARGTMRGDERPPAFDEWGDLFGDGLRAFVIAFVYGLVPGIVGGVFVGGGIFSFVVGSGTESAGFLGLGTIGILLGGLLALVLGLLAAYIVPAAISGFAETGRIGTAFSFDELSPVLTSGTYATAWLSAFAVVLAAVIVGGALNVIPFLGAIVGAFLTFYAAVAAYYLIGSAWGELRSLDGAERDDTVDDQVAV